MSEACTMTNLATTELGPAILIFLVVAVPVVGAVVAIWDAEGRRRVPWLDRDRQHNH